MHTAIRLWLHTQHSWRVMNHQLQQLHAPGSPLLPLFKAHAQISQVSALPLVSPDSYKVHDFILLFRCHKEMEFDIGQREGRYCVHKTDRFASSMLVLFPWMLVWSWYPRSMRLSLFSWFRSFLRHSLLQVTSPSTTISFLICLHQVICNWLWKWYCRIVSLCPESVDWM
jgi:hypothetical protein